MNDSHSPAISTTLSIHFYRFVQFAQWGRFMIHTGQLLLFCPPAVDIVQFAQMIHTAQLLTICILQVENANLAKNQIRRFSNFFA